MPLQTLLDSRKPGSNVKLLLPRTEVAFVPHPGNFTQMYSEVQLPPELATHIIRTDSGILSGSAGIIPNSNLRRGAPQLGYVSGERSGLIPAGNSLYHLKGCRPSRGQFKDHVDGGQSVEAAERELRFLHERIGKALQAEHIEPPYSPIGYFRGNNSEYNGEYATGIKEAKGDTRLDELVARLLERKPTSSGKPTQPSAPLAEVFHKLGHNAGAIYRILHENGLLWNGDRHAPAYSNAHPGNVVVYASQGIVLASMVDFDYSEFTDRRGADELRAQRDEYEAFLGKLLEPAIFSSGSQTRYLDERFQVPNATYFREIMRQGVIEGYRGGGIRTLTLDDIRNAALGIGVVPDKGRGYFGGSIETGLEVRPIPHGRAEPER